jgi:hypothetical protein
MLRLAISSCVLIGLAPAYQDSQLPVAIIGTDRAEFRFPVDTQRYTWSTPEPLAYPGRPEYAWEVDWHPPPDRFGHDPSSLWIVVRWRPGGPRTGTLSELLRDDPLEVMTYCLSCGAPAVTGAADASVVLEVQNGSVVFVVRGREAISRVVPSRPDSVIFTRRRLGVPRDEWKVAVTPPS